MLQWVIVGGGIHGVHLAARLRAEVGLSLEEIRVVDPGPCLLHTWRRCTGNTGMRFLRSPVVHHLDVNPWSLKQFASGKGRGRKRAARGQFSPPYDRPSVQLFASHCDALIEQYDLTALHVRDRVVSLDLEQDHVVVELGRGAPLMARRVILALGASEQPRWPQWARKLREAGQDVQHIFDPGMVLEPAQWPDKVAVIGAGISAAQAALRLADGSRQVHLVARHRLRKHQFDSDPGWVGPKNMRRFTANPDLAWRRQAIRQARHAGSVSPDVHQAVRLAKHRGALHWHQGEVSGAWEDEQMVVHVGNDRLEVDAILLATGFESARPGGALVDGLIARFGLPCAACGYPMVDRQLRWHPRIFVSGPLAELEVGPVSRNIVGARRAAERIIPWVKRHQRASNRVLVSA